MLFLLQTFTFARSVIDVGVVVVVVGVVAVGLAVVVVGVVAVGVIVVIVAVFVVGALWDKRYPYRDMRGISEFLIFASYFQEVMF